MEPGDRWVEAARRGDREALGRAIESCRGYLLMVARRGLPPDVRAKEGASDLVQETMLEAQHRFGQFAVGGAGELRAWLRRLLEHKLAHAVRRYRGVGKRQVAREVSIPPEALAHAVVAEAPSPGARAAQDEEERALRAALDRLPDRQRRAVLWRHLEGCTFEELGRRLGCSNVAARKLWLRALALLHDELAGAGAEAGSGATNGTG